MSDVENTNWNAAAAVGWQVMLADRVTSGLQSGTYYLRLFGKHTSWYLRNRKSDRIRYWRNPSRARAWAQKNLPHIPELEDWP